MFERVCVCARGRERHRHTLVPRTRFLCERHVHRARVNILCVRASVRACMHVFDCEHVYTNNCVESCIHDHSQLYVHAVWPSSTRQHEFWQRWWRRRCEFGYMTMWCISAFVCVRTFMCIHMIFCVIVCIFISHLIYAYRYKCRYIHTYVHICRRVLYVYIDVCIYIYRRV